MTAVNFGLATPLVFVATVVVVVAAGAVVVVVAGLAGAAEAPVAVTAKEAKAARDDTMRQRICRGIAFQLLERVDTVVSSSCDRDPCRLSPERLARHWRGIARRCAYALRLMTASERSAAAISSRREWMPSLA